MLQEESLLRKGNLAEGFVYYDCLVDDGRLTLATIKSAHQNGAVVVYAVEEEMALTVDDFMSRRTGLMHFDVDCGMGAAEEVSGLMPRLLGWSRGRRKAEIERYREAVASMFHFRAETR